MANPFIFLMILIAAVAALILGIIKKNHWLTVPSLLFLLVTAGFIIQACIYLSPFRTIHMEAPLKESHKEEGYVANISCVLPKGKYMVRVLAPGPSLMFSKIGNPTISRELLVNDKKSRSATKQWHDFFTFKAPTYKTKVELKITVKAPDSYTGTMKGRVYIENYPLL